MPRVTHLIHCPFRFNLCSSRGPFLRKQEVRGIQAGIGTGKPQSRIAAEQLVKKCCSRAPKTKNKNWWQRTNVSDGLFVTLLLQPVQSRMNGCRPPVRGAS